MAGIKRLGMRGQALFSGRVSLKTLPTQGNPINNNNNNDKNNNSKSNNNNSSNKDDNKGFINVLFTQAS